MDIFNSNIIKVTFFCAFLCVTWCTQNKIRVTVPISIVLELREQAKKCEEKTGIPASYLKNIIEKTVPPELQVNDFLFCVTNGVGVIDNDGYLDVEKVSSYHVLDGPKGDYVNKIKECNKIVKENPVDTTVATVDCIQSEYQFSAAPQQ